MVPLDGIPAHASLTNETKQFESDYLWKDIQTIVLWCSYLEMTLLIYLVNFNLNRMEGNHYQIRSTN